MKNFIQLTLASAIALLTISSCRKTSEVLPSEPQPIQSQSYLRLAVTGIPASTEDLFAIVSIERKDGESLATNKKVSLHYGATGYLTDGIAAEKGEYKLTKLLVTKASDTALYATPKSQSAKAPQVTTALGLPISVSENPENKTSVQAVKINQQDSPESFGYTAEEFGYFALVKVRLHLSIQVGKTAYDSLPGKLIVDAVNTEGTHWTQEIELAHGLNSLSIPQDYTNYSFTVNKWNTQAQKSYTRQDLQNGMIVGLSAARAAKYLVEESSFIEISGTFVPDNRIEYNYNTSNTLKQVKHFATSTRQSGLVLNNVNKFVYAGNRVDSIIRYAGDTAVSGFVALTWTGGRISNILDKNFGQQTGAAVAYSEAGAQKQVAIDYLYDYGNTMTYRMSYRNGNLVSDNAMSSRGGGESGVYGYDDNVNPYEQMENPNLFLSGKTKNNVIRQEKNYAGGYPTALPYRFEYIYDADGYPKELYTSYKGFTSGKHLYRVKKVFAYR